MIKKDEINVCLCACGAGKKRQGCCLPIIDGRRRAETPLQLMRSRYTAFESGNVRYILQSWHPTTRPERIEIDENIVWSGLNLISVSKFTDEGSEKMAYVEFIAGFTCDGVPGQMHERSRFLTAASSWFYVDGEQVEGSDTDVLSGPGGRNAPCFCGSGKKYKKCCLHRSA